VPRVTVGTDYALSALSDMFPKSMDSNVSFMFTNVLSPLHWNFSLDTVPPALRSASQFLLNNPIALQRKYLKLKNNPSMKKRAPDMHKAVKAGEQNAMQMLVKLFDWLDGLEPQGTAEIVARSQKREVPIANSPSPVDQGLPKEVNDSAVSCLPGTRFLFFSFLLKIACKPIVASKFNQTPMVTEGKEDWVTRTNEVALKNSQEVLEGVEGEAGLCRCVEAECLRRSMPLHYARYSLSCPLPRLHISPL